MSESSAIEFTRILTTLDELYELVSTDAVQPVNQYAEHAVVFWLRILDGKEFPLPRLTRDGYAPGAFHFGMELEHGNRIDAETPGREAGASRQAFASRLGALGGKLEEYCAQSGYRSSSEHCDQMMLEVNHFSRFIAASCKESEQMAQPDGPEAENGGGGPAREGSSVSGPLQYTRRNLFIWEPALNDVIVSWEQNALSEFDRALRELAEMISSDDAEREAGRMLTGFPLRPRGRPRSRVTVTTPVLRPLRTKPMFLARFSQLVRRLEEIGDIPLHTARGLVAEVQIFITMVRTNQFMLASEPSFWDRHRPGIPLIRGRPTTHPFLHDPTDFFKKAVLFHNRTYTVAGGGVDRFYLQVKQLERFYKFSSSVGARKIRSQLDLCVRGWEENRWDAFTEGLLHLAEIFRRQSEAGE